MLFSHVREDGGATFHYPHKDHGSVHVTGSFNGWQTPGQPLRRVEHGWLGEVGPVPWGDVEYKLIVDGRWIADPLNLARRGDNSVLHRGSGRGSVQHLRFHAPALGQERGYVVYLPPGHASGRRFPTLYLLHGALDWEKTWIEKGALAETMDRLRAEGAVGDMIVVMPQDNGDLFRGDERFVDYLAQNLVGHVDYEFPTMADPRRRALDGLSTGGFTSLVLGAARSGTWRSIGSMSGCHDERSWHVVRSNADRMRGQRYLVSCGHGEPHIGDSRALLGELRRLGVDASWADAPGGHDWPLWRDMLATHLRFHWDNLKG